MTKTPLARKEFNPTTHSYKQKYLMDQATEHPLYEASDVY